MECSITSEYDARRLSRSPGLLQEGGRLIDPKTDHGTKRWRASNYVLILIMYKITLRRKIFSESCLSKPNFGCNYPFPIDLTPIGFWLVLNLSKSGNKKPKFLVWIDKIPKNIYLCVQGNLFPNIGK